MNGFLHRLAQRANGTARLVRTTTPALPGWAAPRDATAWPGEWPGHGPLDTGIAEQTAYRGAMPQQADARAVGTPAHVPPVPRHGLQDAGQPDIDPPDMFPSPPFTAFSSPASPGLHRPATTMPPGADAIQRGPMDASPSVIAPAAQPPTATGRDPSTGPVPAKGHASHGVRAATTHDSPRHAMTARDIPGQLQPLLAPVGQPGHAGSGPSPARDPARPSVRHVEETTEVHVHIGRIEVTALPAPEAPPRRPQHNGRAPMSLDDYLARRRGRVSG